MEKNKEKLNGDVKVALPISEKLENFWYHYKWHTIVGLFVIVALLLLTLQTCNKESYDAYILYAGHHEIKKTSESGDISPYATILSSLKKVTSDFDNDGNVNVTLQNLFVLNNEEAEKYYDINPGVSINTVLVDEDTEMLGQNMLYGDYYLCFLSERLFSEYDERYSGAMFCDLNEYLPEGHDYELISDGGVYLRSLGIYSLPGICDLPDDTVVCLRSLSEVSSRLNKSEAEESFRKGEDTLKNILNYK